MIVLLLCIESFVDGIQCVNFVWMPGLIGKVDFTVQHLSSTTTSFTTDFSSLSLTHPCLGSTATDKISVSSFYCLYPIFFLSFLCQV